MFLTKKIEIFILNENKEEKNKQYKELQDLSYNSYKAANRIMSDLYMNLRLANLTKDKIKTETTENDKETTKEINKKVEKYIQSLYNSTSKKNITYKILLEYSKELPSYIRAALSQNITKQFESDTKEILRGDRSLRNYRREGFPIYFMVSKKKWFTIDDKGNIDFKWLNGITFRIKLGRDRSDIKGTIQNILDGVYQFKGSSIMYRKKKWYLNLVADIPKKIHQLNDQLSVGIDVGFSTLAYCGLSKGFNKLALGQYKNDNENYALKRLRLQRRYWQLKKDVAYTRGGKGRKKKLKALDRFREKERNFVKTINHKISAAIIKFTLSCYAGVIKLEDLSKIDKSINENKWMSRNWTYYELQKQIEYKAKLNNINVVYIDPKNTTKECSSCGHINKEIKLGTRKYECPVCKTKHNRDYNAAVNIARSEKVTKIIK
jgi:IS605 OrfB family transposase